MNTVTTVALQKVENHLETFEIMRIIDLAWDAVTRILKIHFITPSSH